VVQNLEFRIYQLSKNPNESEIKKLSRELSQNSDTPTEWIESSIRTRIREIQSHRQLVEAGHGKWRVISWDSYDPRDCPMVKDFDNEISAKASVYWQEFCEREQTRLRSGGQEEERKERFWDFAKTPTPEFIARLDEEMKISKKSKRGIGSEVYYIYNPEGELIDHLGC
jgi:hypothetical protein